MIMYLSILIIHKHTVGWHPALSCLPQFEAELYALARASGWPCRRSKSCGVRLTCTQLNLANLLDLKPTKLRAICDATNAAPQWPPGQRTIIDRADIPANPAARLNRAESLTKLIPFLYTSHSRALCL